MTGAAASRFPVVGDTILGRYRLKRIIAKGGMGMVYLAEQLSMDRDVAIKMVLPQNMDNEQTLARFEREVHLAKQLRHPNIVELYDFGRTEGDVLYLVMEMLKGRDLKRVIADTGPLSVGRCGHIALQVLDALSVAHQRGIVHRDLKPSNVFITKVGRHVDFVKLLDFGVAKSLGQEDVELTQQGQVCGTSAYMAPEMFVNGSVDLTVDVYAMGLILVEMLIGQKVFQGSTTAENMLLHLKEGVTTPAPLIDTALGDVIERATARRARRRYRTAAEMLDALEEALDAMPEEQVVDRQSAAAAVASLPSEEDVLEHLLGSSPSAALRQQTADSSDLMIIEYESGKKFKPPPLPQESAALLDGSDSGVRPVAAPSTGSDRETVPLSASDVAVPQVNIDDTPTLGAESTEPDEAEEQTAAAHVSQSPLDAQVRSSEDVLQTIKQPAWDEGDEDAQRRRSRPSLPQEDAGIATIDESDTPEEFEQAETELMPSGPYPLAQRPEVVAPPDRGDRALGVHADPMATTAPMRSERPAQDETSPGHVVRTRSEPPDPTGPDEPIQRPAGTIPARIWIPAGVVMGLVMAVAAVVIYSFVAGDGSATENGDARADQTVVADPADAVVGSTNSQTSPEEPEPDPEPELRPPEPEPVRWHVRITSEPPGAKVMDGDQELGVTPTTMSLGEGAVPDTIVLELEGYEPAEVAIETEPGGGEIDVERELEPKPKPKKKKKTRRKKKPKENLDDILGIGKFD